MRRTARQRVNGFLWFIFVLFFISGMIVIAFFLTGYLYEIANWHPSILLAQIVNTLLGLFFTGTMIGTVGKVARSKGWFPEMNVFAPVLDALERIARGDFSVRLDNQFQDNPMVGELTKSINTMALQLDQMENLRQEFISNVSHEIQSPLTSIRGFARALENDQLTQEERHHYLSIIEEESMRLSRITEDLLKMAALESDELKFEPQTYQLDKQIRKLILACEPQWSAKSIQLEVSLEELEITADEDLLSQVWINLIHNAIKFTPEAGSITVTLSPREDQVEFKISDSGMGIAEEDREHIFERFYKADKSRTRASGGSGLGLAIVKKIVDLHKGTIEVQSKENSGATFTIKIPIE
jgi:two-component system, OmpR family, phosphate regulon sensor histidine kinase PhoR